MTVGFGGLAERALWEAGGRGRRATQRGNAQTRLLNKQHHTGTVRTGCERCSVTEAATSEVESLRAAVKTSGSSETAEGN